jgi:hypothetical protein
MQSALPASATAQSASPAERHLEAALAEAEAIGAAPRAESTRALLHRAREEIGP